MIEIISTNLTNKFLYLNECKCDNDEQNSNYNDEL